MHSKDFSNFVLSAQQNQINTLGVKSQEYSTEDDKFDNFRRGARMLGISPAQMCAAWKSKHDISIEMIMDGTVKANPDMLMEKFTDAINYLYLQWGLMLEECDED